MKNFKIIQEKQNSLFNRKEIQAEVQADVTPKNDEVLKMLSEKFSVPAEAVKIESIKGKFGSNIFIILARVYDSEENKLKIERTPKKKK